MSHKCVACNKNKINVTKNIIDVDQYLCEKCLSVFKELCQGMSVFNSSKFKYFKHLFNILTYKHKKNQNLYFITNILVNKTGKGINKPMVAYSEDLRQTRYVRDIDNFLDRFEPTTGIFQSQKEGK